ncbi:LacI family DNA-binding transcriptional regulator [Paenibacillus beijingensis]|nr:LacI family DNA-binding transcriptional regulator [Paenibacillus beijingensis]
MSTIQDVAKHAGISIATVSRALNNPDKVSTETRERVMEAVRQLEYYPNEKAKLLSSKTKEISVGIIIPYISSYYFGELYKGISRTAKAQNVRIVLHELHDESGEQSLMDALTFCKQQGVSGILLSSQFVEKDYDLAISRLKLPVVLVLAHHESAMLPAFKIDDIKASFDAVSYLVTRGHKRIGIISGSLSNPVVGEPRYIGAKNAIDFYQLPFHDKQLVSGGIRFEDGYKAMNELLAARDITGITAVFTATDELAFGAMKRVRDAGLRVPEDISVIGFDNLSISGMFSPGLTTVSQPFADIGVEGVNHLIQAIKNPAEMKPGTYYLPYNIVERESVAQTSD